MPHIIDTQVHLEFPLGQHLHCLVAQLPVRLQHGPHGYALRDPDAQWRVVRSVLDLVAEDDRSFRRLHFLTFPESAVPAARLDDALSAVERRFRGNTVVIFGVDHLTVRTYRALLERFRRDNGAALALVQRDVDAGDVLDLPVNACCVAVKEPTGRVRAFLEAKTHPFHGEEILDKFGDLYRGRHLYLFRAEPSCFNFMALVCLDYLYRDLYASNVRKIIDHANQLYFTTRQALDALFVIQCDPKPEHAAYRQVLTGFYGEYLEDTPGVRDTVTVFGNASDESAVGGEEQPGAFGRSSVVVARRHKLAHTTFPEFLTDDLGGAPLCRLRFGTGTRLLYFNLPLHHELDPRSYRLPLKVHRILRASDGRWVPIATEGGAAGEPTAGG